VNGADFDRVASIYDDEARHWKSIHADICGSFLIESALQCCGRILDLGCGSGIELKALFDLGVKELFGMDPSFEFLRIASRKLDRSVQLVQGVGEAIPFDRNAL
jgi:ubiquinone/menaquinone biosynthesis C-methylase UbiE